MGATGCGKSHWTKACLRTERPGRLLIVDPDDEYGGIAERCTLAEARIESKGKAWRVRVVPSFDQAIGRKQFELACRIAWEAAQAAPVTFCVDELADFVTASEAGPEWRRLVRRGRKHGVTVYALSQRPASIDKGIWSQATVIRCGRLNYTDDQVTMAKALCVPVQEVAALTGRHWIAADRVSGKLLRG